MSFAKPLASVSLDLDNLWSYLKTHGEPGWEARPSYLADFLPIALDLLDELGFKITFFVVGVDAAREENTDALASITARGHEVGNHSYEHEPWLHRYSRSQLESEIERAETAIEAATGQCPIGFRGPGFSWSKELLEVLLQRGYLFDASTLPTYMGPLARAYYFWTARLSAAARNERKALFGTLRDGLRPVKPYRWRLDGDGSLLEIPVTTVPAIKTPFHLSYLLYLSRLSERLMVVYLDAALAACRVTSTEPSFLLHPLDLIGGDQVRELAFFPGMELSGARKRAVFMKVLGMLGQRFEVVGMGRHARTLLERGRLRSVTPAHSWNNGRRER
jgi:peptidoglycan/xylan/chitin deacetylase (PgdA/CDA1 family)